MTLFENSYNALFGLETCFKDIDFAFEFGDMDFMSGFKG